MWDRSSFAGTTVPMNSWDICPPRSSAIFGEKRWIDGWWDRIYIYIYVIFWGFCCFGGFCCDRNRINKECKIFCGISRIRNLISHDRIYRRNRAIGTDTGSLGKQDTWTSHGMKVLMYHSKDIIKDDKYTSRQPLQEICTKKYDNPIGWFNFTLPMGGMVSTRHILATLA